MVILDSLQRIITLEILFLSFINLLNIGRIRQDMHLVTNEYWPSYSERA